MLVVELLTETGKPLVRPVNWDRFDHSGNRMLPSDLMGNERGFHVAPLPEPAKWDCNYHVLFVPKPPRKAISGQPPVNRDRFSTGSYAKGKRAIVTARLCGKERNNLRRAFLGSGYVVSTVGLELEPVRQYIAGKGIDGNSGQF